MRLVAAWMCWLVCAGASADGLHVRLDTGTEPPPRYVCVVSPRRPTGHVLGQARFEHGNQQPNSRVGPFEVRGAVGESAELRAVEDFTASDSVVRDVVRALRGGDASECVL